MNKTKERSKNIKLRWGETKILKGGGGGEAGGGGVCKMCGVGILKWGAETPLQTMSYTQIEI